MNLANRLLAMCLMILLTAPVALSQEKQSGPATAEASGKEGLRKIASGSGDQAVEVHIDDEALEATIQSSVENAMEIVHDVLQNLEINIEPIAIDVSTINMDIDPIHIDVPRIDIDLDEVEVNNQDVDVNIDEDVSHWKDENEAHEDHLEDSDDKAQHDRMDRSPTTINKNKGKDTADRDDKEKAKGLKKIN